MVIGWEKCLILLALLSFAFSVMVCVAGAKRARRDQMLRRLNSPHFRCITSPYYRANHYRVGSDCK